MENDFRFGYQQHMYLMSPNPSLLGFSTDTSRLNNEPVCENPRSADESTLRNGPLFPFSGFQQPRASEPNNSQNWPNNMPRFHNAFDLGQQKTPTTGPTLPQKRFLVFDQSGGKTTLIYSSGAPTPVQFGASWVPNPITTYNLAKEGPRFNANPLRPSVNDETIEDNSEDEMHEDTEELDALLCSDNDYSEDDEETSTGHSPSTMTDNVTRDLVDEIGEEVDSYAGSTKRQKILSEGYNVPLNGPSKSSLKTHACSAVDDDAESICGDVNKNCKRSRKEKIQETMSVLETIIPNAKGKDVIVVIDEAIRYLRSLKVKVKALGPDAL